MLGSKKMEVTAQKPRHQMNLQSEILDLGRRARAASRSLARLTSAQKNGALQSMADEIVRRTPDILGANAEDVRSARGSGITGAMLDRLTLNPPRVEAMAEGIRAVVALPDPVGTIIREWTQPSGLHISKVRVPIG